MKIKEKDLLPDSKVFVLENGEPEKKNMVKQKYIILTKIKSLSKVKLADTQN